jgi:hypothetical protein
MVWTYVHVYAMRGTYFEKLNVVAYIQVRHKIVLLGTLFGFYKWCSCIYFCMQNWGKDSVI